ncbi:hypothetical protein [Limnobacter parvus]|uniref:Uncharacterized protein n=1 Tax=Limnobacter parvus TaxID=2939690 RepID=A0ABT1XDC2_9BURK|nr:hypothetical protein [Limnobacter parvus]MCR2745260.1 hypothetical protein [Limnobacter parvus]
MIEISGYVVEANSSFLRVIALSQVGASCLKQLGFSEESPLSFTLSVNSPNDRVRLFQELRANDFAFSAGREWSPSELFEFFRDQGLLSGDYIRVAWIDGTSTTLTLS